MCVCERGAGWGGQGKDEKRRNVCVRDPFVSFSLCFWPRWLDAWSTGLLAKRRQTRRTKKKKRTARWCVRFLGERGEC